MNRWMAIFRQLLALYLVFLGTSCESCVQKKAEEQRAPLSQEDLDKFFIDPTSVFSKIKYFSFKSEMIMSIQKDDITEKSRELIEIVGDDPYMHLKKKIDDFHFIELFSDGKNFFTKSQEGNFHNGGENKQMYQGLLKDALNSVGWFIEEFGLGNQLIKENKDIFVVNNLNLLDAPFLKNLREIREEIESTSISGRIVLDEKTQLPIVGKFDVAVAGKNQFFITIAAQTSLDLKKPHKKLLLPEASNDEPFEIPVNIAPRFNELMHLREGGTP